MRVLALDTSTEVAGVALLAEGRPRFSHSFLHRMDLSQRLLPSLQWLLADTGVPFSSIEALVVGRGPGSFTGVRIGVTTAKVLAQVTGIPLVGVGTLAAMAAAFEACRGLLVCPAIDARKHEVYGALYRMGEEGPVEVLAPRAMPAEALARCAAEYDEPVAVCGTGAARYRAALEAALGTRLRAAPGHDFPDPVVLAHLGLRRLARGERDDPLALVPIYARPSEAERNLQASGQA